MKLRKRKKMGEIKKFLRYLFLIKIYHGLKSLITKPSNWYFVLLIVLVYTILSEAVKHNFNFNEINFSIYWFLTYLVGIVIISIYKEFVSGEWKHYYRTNVRKPK